MNQKRAARGNPPEPAKQNLAPVAGIAADMTLNVTPLDLLHAIGLATTRPVPNLADLSATWACWRYIWAFEVPAVPGPVPLRLSSVARAIDFHQKGLLSDEIGVGMACLLLGSLLGAPKSIDVQVALQDSAWAITRDLTTTPDYLCYNSTFTTLFVVECKGNQTSRSQALEQLRRDTEQLPSIRFLNRPTPPGIVVVTHLTRRGTEVLLIDPPSDPPSPPNKEPSQPEVPPGKSERLNQREWQVHDGVRLFKEIRAAHQAQLLNFAGDETAARQKLPGRLPPERERFVGRREPQIVVEAAGGEYVGVQDDLPMRSEIRVRMFRGLSRERYKQYKGAGADVVAPEEDQPDVDLVPHGAERRPSFVTTIAPTGDAVAVESRSTDDTLLRFELRPA